MKRRGNYSHYENAVESFLQANCVAYVATNESKKIITKDGKIKNFDLIILGKEQLLLDIKGRKYGYEGAPKNLWENWILKEDLVSLKKWCDLFSDNQRSQKAYLLYAFCLPDLNSAIPEKFKNNVYLFNKRLFAFFVIDIRDYIDNCKQRSITPPSVSVSRKLFSSLLKPLSEILKENSSMEVIQ